jgi:hypothetical protein
VYTVTAAVVLVRPEDDSEPRPAVRPGTNHGRRVLDFDHGQTGVAPNAIELHPILAFRCLSG